MLVYLVIDGQYQHWLNERGIFSGWHYRLGHNLYARPGMRFALRM